MATLFDYLCAIWTLAGCMFGLIVIAAIIKAFIEMWRK